MTKIRVLHCAETIKGGIATYLRELLPLQVVALGAGAVAVVIPKSQVADLPLPEGVRLFTYPDNGSRLINSLILAKIVLKLLRSTQTSTIHIHSTFAGASLRPSVRLFFKKVKIVYCPHGWAWDRPMAKWKQTLTICVERFLACFCDRIICISQHERKTANGAGIRNKLEVIMNGIGDIKSPPSITSHTWPDESRKLLFVGRFDRQKGADIFCEALRLLNNEASGILVGDYVLGDSKQLNIPSNINHVGWLDATELLELYASADVLVVPSRWEGFGLVAAEAMRSSLPVIASRVGGLSEIVDDKKTGILIAPSNVQELIHAIRSLDSQSILSMGREGRLRFEKLFSIERTHDEILKLYADIRNEH